MRWWPAFLCPTRRVIEASLLTIGLSPGIATPSSFFLMVMPGGKGRAYVFADCAVNADPAPEDLADIAIASAESARSLLGEEPRVALLSFSTHGSAAHARVDKVRAAVAAAQAKRPDLAIDGELQGDAALSEAVAGTKLKRASAVAGQANVLVFRSGLRQYCLQARAAPGGRPGCRPVPAGLRQAGDRTSRAPPRSMTSSPP